MINNKLLKSKMVLKGEDNFVQALADLLHVSRTTASKKFNGETPFGSDEMELIMVKYDLTPEDIVNIFLRSKGA